MGDEYTETRHNIGFKIVEALAEEAGASFISDRLAFHANFRYKGKFIHVIKPTTYMNLSGKAVKYWIDKLGIEKESLLVIVDDIAIPFGTLRIRSKGSDGNHNGLTSVQEVLQTTEYPRLRFGIGGNYPKGQQINYVLGKWNAEERKALPGEIEKACEVVKSFTTIGLERTMNNFNTLSKTKHSGEE